MATQLGFEMRPIPLTKQQRLAGLKPEWRSRIDKQTKQHFVYVCEDRFGNGTVIVCPKLTTLSEFLSSRASLKTDKITVSSLYNMLSVKEGEGRSGSWSKGRWRVRAVPLDAAVDRFEQLRHSGDYEHAVVLGSDRCTVIQPA